MFQCTDYCVRGVYVMCQQSQVQWQHGETIRVALSLTFFVDVCWLPLQCYMFLSTYQLVASA